MGAHFKRLLKVPFEAAARLNTQRSVRQLCGHDTEALRCLGEALSDTLSNQVSAEERPWIERIQCLRDELSASTVKIVKKDYGAGSPQLGLGAEAMSEGRVVTQSVGEICKIASKGYIWSLLLFKLIRKFNPAFCLELGTCLGISAGFQGSALKLNGSGKLVTLEGADTLVALARKHMEQLSLDNVDVVCGRFQDTLGGVLQRAGQVDFAFVDGHHDQHATIDYFQQILPFSSKRAVLVFDDISWSDGMRKAWETVAADTRIRTSLDLGQLGVCLLDDEIRDKQSLSLLIG